MDIDPNQAINYIVTHAPKYAQAKADRVYVENFISSVKSRLMNEEEGTVANKEAYAKAHPDYIAQINALKIATEEEEKLRFLMKAAELRVEVWKLSLIHI